ncbi:LOW QUALITY PROTEIN: formimidoyltransferase-cyclodeaminase [Sceloporus undulatus]|uniref:LOW QUALITY PROTEIN: formimidoyltransferase-cyclodeaminase n=1 Tax=Sceloporus undulatus TaxID=8520 RepID=UPI001C4A7FB9|nr:LOW QUALITY PROTEIN: formimidoyltransferase-cyclodeaminase [Sceloporus undulatus]
MSKLVECVPNFSEGNNKEVIDEIAKAISQTEGCILLDVDAGPSTNRTVYTFVGSPQDIIEGALNAARTAFQLIDMARHKGEHPRMGALDVCPFVPVMNVTMEECIRCANLFGKRLADELCVPVYLYGEAAVKESRRSLPAIRAGEYEALPEKLYKVEWSPDFGPATFVPRWGATVTGARKFLIAYNINLLCTKELAHRIALNIREQGRGKDQPGRLKQVQGMGWYLDEENIAQVSTNLLDFETTSLHVVYEEVCSDAKELNLPVVGSQLVGLIPKKAMLDAAEFYIKKDNLFILEEDHKIRLVINRLGLDSLSPFNPKERIIEYMMQDSKESSSLVSLPLHFFVQKVGARSAAPGGGSVSAAMASLGAALGCMVGQMTYGKRQFEDLDPVMRKLIPPFHQAMKELVVMVDTDSSAFSGYMDAMKLPKTTPEEKERRTTAMQLGLKKAVGVPFSLAEKVHSLWPFLREMAQHGNVACKSDIQVAAKALEAGVFGAYFNVVTNLKDITDEDFKKQAIQDLRNTSKSMKPFGVIAYPLFPLAETIQQTLFNTSEIPGMLQLFLNLGAGETLSLPGGSQEKFSIRARTTGETDNVKDSL